MLVSQSLRCPAWLLIASPTLPSSSLTSKPTGLCSGKGRVWAHWVTCASLLPPASSSSFFFLGPALCVRQSSTSLTKALLLYLSLGGPSRPFPQLLLFSSQAASGYTVELCLWGRVGVSFTLSAQIQHSTSHPVDSVDAELRDFLCDTVT